MDPNEMAQKLLKQDPFHEVRRKRDNKKEHEYAANMGIIDDKRPIRRNTQWAKPPASWNQNARERDYSRNAVSGIKEFRIVRDNRANQNANCNAKPEASQDPASGGQEVLLSVSEKNDTKNLNGHKSSAARNPEVHTGPGYVRDVDLNGTHNSLLPQGTQPTVSVSTSHSPKEVQNNSRVHSEATSTNYVIGLYPSSSDPVHVPSPDSRSGGKVGAIRREVGVVGVQRQSSNGVPNNSSSFPSSKKDLHSAESFGDTVSTSKNNQLNQTPASEHVHTMSTSKPFSSGQNNNKLHQQVMSHQKASEPNMEWKPKSSKKASTVRPGLFGTISAPFSSSIGDSSRSSKVDVDVAVLSEKLEHVNIMENQHVLIPKHFRVAESERTWLTFGSFGVGFDSTKGFISLQTTENSDLLKDEPSISTSASVPMGPCEDGSTSGQGDFEDQTRTSLSDSPTSSGTHQPPTGNEYFSPKIIDSYEDIGLLQSHSPSYGAPEQQLQESPSLPGFSAYDTQTSYDSPFFRTVMEDNVCGQGLASPSEALGLHDDVTITGSPSPVSLTHQQQPTAQMYSQVQISQIPNFLPYRHIFSPVYIPPVAIQNYPSNPSYPHPSNGSNYLLMPGGSSHLIAGGVKYGAPQYKQVPSGGPVGYGNYNSSGFTISTPASIGGVTGLEDVSRIKYKDNLLYVPNHQTESSDIWIQTPRELPGLQSAAAPYYNLTGPLPHAAFMPAHTSHAPFSAAEPHAQYPGLYQSQQQPASISDSHHLVQQPINPGFAPNPQLGTFQQSQMSRFNWNFNV